MSDQPNEMLVQDAPLENLPAIKQENPEASGDDTHSDRGSALYRVYANNLKEARRALKKGLQPSIAKQAGPSGSSKSLTREKFNAPSDLLGKRKALAHVDQVFAESQIVELLQK